MILHDGMNISASLMELNHHISRLWIEETPQKLRGAAWEARKIANKLSRELGELIHHASIAE
jgi:hypothetical protein